MGISSSLYSAISGLNTNGNAMSVIGNNLANTNTVGFKASRTVFADMLSSAVNGASGVNQIGNGATLSTVDNIFSQGTFENTNSSTDMAIEGEGFFLVRSPDSGQTYYTRAGSFRFDENGYLVNPQGYLVQGKGFNSEGELTAGDQTDIRVDINASLPARMSSSIGLVNNLDANSETVQAPFDQSDPATYNYASSATVYDSLGNTHMLTTYFSKLATNTWSYHVVNENGDVVAASDDAWTETVDGEDVTYTFDETATMNEILRFTEDGTQIYQLKEDGSIKEDADGNPIVGDVILDLNLNWGTDTIEQPITLTFNTSQYASESQVISVDQDGYAAGNLAKVAIDNDGVVTANYTNGEEVKVSQIALAKFANPNGLEKVGNSMFAATGQAGPPRIGLPGSELGNLYTNTLEQSTVDMASEFVKMITTQRGFQANSRVITTTDEMLNELINLKR
jgi:flagellar hook protein FlgE